MPITKPRPADRLWGRRQQSPSVANDVSRPPNAVFATRGRPVIELTNGVIEGITQLVRGAVSFRTACETLGVSKSVAYRWAAQGERDLADGVESMQARFSDALTRARAVAEALLIQQVRQAGDTDWRAAAFLLARCYPERWGDASKINHEGTGNAEVALDRTIFLDARGAKLAAELFAELPDSEGRTARLPGGVEYRDLE
jgi:hypothetical protein